MVATTLTPARALRRPRRLDVRALLGILLMVAATGGSILAWSALEDSRGVLVAARDLAAGQVLTASDLGVARVRVDDALYAAAVPAESLRSLVGRQLAEPAHANQVLVRAQLSTHPTLTADQRVYSIPVRADSAAGGQLRAGDQVEVVGINSRGGGSARVVLPRATIYDVGRERASSVGVGSQAATQAQPRGFPCWSPRRRRCGWSRPRQPGSWTSGCCCLPPRPPRRRSAC